MLKHDNAHMCLRLIVGEVIKQDDIDVFVTVKISSLVPVCFQVILKLFHMKKIKQQHKEQNM